jgi:hypothetical protein
MIYNSSSCVCWFLSLVSDQKISERKFGSKSALFILYAFILFMVNKVVIFGIFNL